MVPKTLKIVLMRIVHFIHFVWVKVNKIQRKEQELLESVASGVWAALNIHPNTLELVITRIVTCIHSEWMTHRNGTKMNYIAVKTERAYQPYAHFLITPVFELK